MKTTGNLGLKKPDGTDIVDITDLNGNMDILDTAVKAVQDHAADAVKHITAADRTAWNAKASTAAATASAAGLMAAADKAKLDGVAAGANNYVHPNHTGDVTSTGDGVTAIAPGVIVNADINAAAAIDASKIGTGVVSNAEFGYLDGVTAGIQGQLNGKANLTTTPQQTTADITYYVRTDGNDGNTGLGNTAGGAFRTIQKAINSVPYHVDHAVNIYVNAGTYAEDVKVSDFNGSTELYIYGATTAATVVNYVVNSFKVYGCSNQIYIQGFTASTKTKTAFDVVNTTFCQLVLCRAVVTTTPPYTGVEASNGSTVRVASCELSNRSTAIHATQGALVNSWDNTGTGNAYGITATEGGTATKAGTQASSVQGDAINRGTITNGVINPWGDNTWTARSFMYATHSVQQTFSANVLTKVIYGWEGNDNLGEYDPATGIFTAKMAGVYMITASIQFTNAISGIELKIGVGSASGGTLFMSHTRPGSSGYTAASGSATLGVAAGGTLAIWATATAGVSTNPDPSYSYLMITRIA
ncbi:hypothetical protein MKX70_09375 [Paenibacillus sp. FSL R7-0312]|uniref:hypothetical protein n=1 Tax=Paenibacillus sp. FSL R7-0312 TaxID=2921682 RepID=UPI0030F81093